MINGIKRGKAAEHIFAAKALLYGYEVFMPLNDDGRIDTIVNGHRVQIKVVSKGDSYKTSGYIKLIKSGKRSTGEVKKYSYTKEDVDFIAGIDTDTFDFYILPIAYVANYASTVGISRIVLDGYINNMSILA